MIIVLIVVLVIVCGFIYYVRKHPDVIRRSRVHSEEKEEESGNSDSAEDSLKEDAASGEEEPREEQTDVLTYNGSVRSKERPESDDSNVERTTVLADDSERAEQPLPAEEPAGDTDTETNILSQPEPEEKPAEPVESGEKEDKTERKKSEKVRISEGGVRLDTIDRKYYVLIADHNQAAADSLAEEAEKCGCDVTKAKSGPDCLQKTSRNHFDLILIAESMPRMDGIQTLHNIRNSTGSKCRDSVAVVLLDSAVKDDPREFYKGKGFFDALMKPVEQAVLENLLLKCVPEKMLTQDDGLYQEIRNYGTAAGALSLYGIHLKEGILGCDGSFTEFCRKAREFCQDYDTAGEALSGYLKKGNTMAYMEDARKQRELCRKLGIPYLADMFDDHVNMAKDDSLDVAGDHWEMLRSVWKHVVTGLSAWLADNE